MTASQKPKTPSMAMAVRPDIPLSDVDAFCKKASRLVLSQVVDSVTVKERLTVKGDARRTEFIIDITFFPREEYEAEYDAEPSEILSAFATKFPLILKKEIQTDMKKLDADLRGQITELGKAKTVKDRISTRGGEEGDDEKGAAGQKNDDNDSEAGDGDAGDAKRSRQKKEQTSYESDEEDVEAYDDDAIEAEFAENENNGIEDEDENTEESRVNELEDQAATVADLFKANFHHATEFSFHESGCKIQLQVTFTSLRTSSPLTISLVRFRLPKTPACWPRRADMPKDRDTRDTWHKRLFPSQGRR
jgi:DNA-directed RNA polymerase I subunit RPA1